MAVGTWPLTPEEEHLELCRRAALREYISAEWVKAHPWEKAHPFLNVLLDKAGEGGCLRTMCRRRGSKGLAGSKEWRRLQRYRKRTGDHQRIWMFTRCTKITGIRGILKERTP